jgi:uncharacterized protein YndB with AHSA1/START domain
MDTIRTHVFDIASAARPEQVWAALTRPGSTARYLFGMAVVSTWESGAPVELVLGPPDRGPMYENLRGEVLTVQEPRRLSYSLGSGPAQPETYVTWQIDPDEDGRGSRVRLYVDETEAGPETGDDRSDETLRAWAPVVAAFESVLASLPLS